jgi:hypothetical protein
MDWQPLVYGLQLQSSPVCGLFAVHRTGLSNTTDTSVHIEARVEANTGAGAERDSSDPIGDPETSSEKRARPRLAWKA